MKRFGLLAMATIAGYVAVMSAILAAILGWSIREEHELAYLLPSDYVPVDHGLLRLVGIFALMTLLGVWGHIAILRRVE